ncbi:MAG: thioredoxin family protein [Bacteroidota bacterium]
MAVVSSDPLPLGTAAPEFALPAANPETAGADSFRLGDLADARALLVVFTCNHCPYAIEVEDRLIALANERQPDGLRVVAISSNDAEQYPADSFENMTRRAQEKSYPFPYLYDETQEIARAYRAVCTPDFFLFDGSRRLVYAGRMDDGRPNRPSREGHEPTTRELAEAVEHVLAGESVTVEQIPSMGCSIKWKTA